MLNSTILECNQKIRGKNMQQTPKRLKAPNTTVGMRKCIKQMHNEVKRATIILKELENHVQGT